MASQKNQNIAHKVAAAIDRASDLINRCLFDDAWNVLVQAEHVAKGAGIESPFLRWGLAVAADQRGDASNAVRNIMAALKGDPCSPPIQGSYRIILRRVRAAFDAYDPEDSRVSIFYGLLQELDAADASASFKYSLCAQGHGDRATALVFARVALSTEPPTPERLRHLARLLAAEGHAVEASTRLREAEELANTFPCPAARA